MRIEIRNSCANFRSYRAARVKSLFNVESGADFQRDVELPLEGEPWKLGLVVGPSGSGKSSLGRQFWGGEALWDGGVWPNDAPIVDAILPGGGFDAVTAALAAVGLGSVPAWLRPYHALSNGERFRAELARIIAERPPRVVVDEFTSVVDRQIARIGALAFAKAWRRDEGQCVLLSCHYDIIEWLEPDWVYDLGTDSFQQRRCLPRRPRIELELWETNWSYWPLFEPHHYLRPPKMMAATCYVGAVGGEPVAHVAFSTRPGLKEARAARLVVMPEWQGVGIGRGMLNAVCDLWRRGQNRYGLPMPTLLNTSHPGLATTLRRDPRWCQVSTALYGANRIRSAISMRKSEEGRSKVGKASGYGGHLRAVQGFRYLGDP